MNISAIQGLCIRINKDLPALFVNCAVSADRILIVGTFCYQWPLSKDLQHLSQR